MPATPVPRAKIGEAIRRHRAEVLAAWRRSVRTLPPAHDMLASQLVDHIPDLLDEVAALAERAATGQAIDAAFRTARRHALDRLDAGFDISAVVRELSLLREALLRVWSEAHVDLELDDLRTVDAALDLVIGASIQRYTETRERTLAAIDRISAAAFEARDVGELLQRLLAVFRDTTPAVDAAAILLVERGRLCVRAAVGFGGGNGDGRGPPPSAGEAFAETIAARRAPVELAHLKPDDGTWDGLRALYGVPLVHDGELIGVAHMGSLTATEFSLEERHLFDSMAVRATTGLAQHMLRQELARVALEREGVLARLESLVAAAPVGIAFLDRELRYVTVNDALARLNGRPAAEHVGRSVLDVLPPEAADQIVPVLERVRDTGETVVDREVAIPGQRTVLTSFFPVRAPSGEILGVGGVIADITAARRAQEALRGAEVSIQSILEHAPAAIWVKASDGTIVLANRRVAEVFGRPRDELLGRRSEDLLPPELAAVHEAHDRAAADGARTIEVEEEIPSPSGMRTFLAIKFPIPSDPPMLGGIATEITERKRMEEELRIAVRTREDLLAVVSHDLRSPLQAVQLSATLLEGQVGADARMRRNVEIVLRSCRRMENLIDDLLDTAMIRMGRLELHRTPEAADALVGEAFDVQARAAAERGLGFARADAASDLRVLCDRDRILRVFVNIVGNAIKFCRPGDAITLGAERAGETVAFSVTDTGPGIQPDLLRFLFDPYWSAAQHRARGSGLGLYIARAIVEAHGGRIWVDSTPGAGARFAFTLPLAPS
ncbi:MAG: PAS domain-containing protein [Deltaproteobacteria bacterium]|nr:PAS domain-containing protein [Deltaproteobacteria bacterium]